jgi:hypothetical protein
MFKKAMLSELIQKADFVLVYDEQESRKLDSNAFYAAAAFVSPGEARIELVCANDTYVVEDAEVMYDTIFCTTMLKDIEGIELRITLLKKTPVDI